MADITDPNGGAAPDAAQYGDVGSDTLGNLARAIGGLRRHQMDVAAGAQNLQASAFHGGQMRAARDEGDVGTGFRERRAETASDAAGADNRDPHGATPSIRRVG